MTRKNRELLFATVSTALQVRESTIDGTLHCFKHFDFWVSTEGILPVEKPSDSSKIGNRNCTQPEDHASVMKEMGVSGAKENGLEEKIGKFC